MPSVEDISTRRNLPIGIRVLHVDADEAVLQASRESLERENDIDTVVPVTSNDDAIDYLSEHHADIDCVVSDYDPECGSGLKLLDTVRERWPSLPFIVFTGSGSEDVASRAMSSGATNYLQKGTTDTRLLSLISQIRQAVSHRRTEKEVHRGFRAIEMTNEGIALLTNSFDFNYVNEAYADLFGYDQETLIGLGWAETMSDESVERLRSDIVPTVDSEGEWTGEVTGQNHDGNTLTLTLSISTIAENEYVCAVRDVTERKEREEELIQENERLDKFASKVSHDLRSPLSIIYGYLNVARKTGKEEHFDEIEAAADRIEAIITDLLEVAREGQKELDREVIHLHDFVEHIWDGIESGEATLYLTFSDVRIVADHGRLTELFANLFRNAVEHGGNDVAISVGTTDNGFYIEDDGSGIPEEQRQSIVESGYSTADSTGLGLSIVQEIADSHGWKMHVEDSDEGGARFRFSGVECTR
ncbi:ATP-binding response regulator [Haladaptatus cibarius]|uniref:ATP-binding response regulator n=1 Tax=Haladaptatus cibarius TaxID=453847 RepID=UPI0006793D2B|nr:ATP-binding protein [Haladaptatus cibarius]